MKTRKQKQAFTIAFLRILDVIKLFHWNTKDYSKHKATDELHETLSKLIDSYVEKYFGEKERVIVHETVRYDTLTDEAFLKEIKRFEEYLTRLSCPTPGLTNIRDEMLGEVSQFLYLWSLR